MNKTAPATLLVVDDLQQSLSFYTKVLNLAVIEQHKDCIKLNSGGHDIIMFQGDSAAVDYAHGYNANSTLLFTVDNLDQQIERLKAHRVEFVHATPNENRWGRYAAFKDPSGIIHELFELFEN